MNLGEEIYSDLEKNTYLIKIYNEIIKSYSHFLLDKEINLEINLRHGCQFIDLLSKSNHKIKENLHKNLAQEMVILLELLKPNDLRVKHLFSSVLANLNNFIGMQIKGYNYKYSDFYEEVYFSNVKKILRIPLEKNKYFLESQKEVFEKFKSNYFSYSGPTSMGKSFIMRIFIKERIIKNYKENYVILVPTKALINEVKNKLILDLNTLLEEKSYKILTTANQKKEENKNYVYVLTPERFLYLLIKNNNININYLFIDEAHKISSDDPRSIFYYKVIDMVAKNNTKIFFSSPNIPNPEIYLKLLNKSIENNAKNYNYTPVNQYKFYLDIENKKTYFYSTIEEKLIEINLEKEYINLIDLLLNIGKDKQNIVYCSSKNKAVKYATEYLKKLPKEKEIDSEINELIKEIKRVIHEECDLIEMLEKNIAFHVAYLPISIKEEIERLYRIGKIKTIFCTSTLIEGVNLPADNLYILSTKQGNKNMNSVDFKNLIGRAGRIEYNLYGNVFIVNLEKDVKKEKVKKLLNKQIEPQKLSIEKYLTPQIKKNIIKSLADGELEIEKLKNPNEVNCIRKITNILLKDILSDNESYIKREFQSLLSKEQEIKIKTTFSEFESDDDINLSIYQLNNLKREILNKEYPLEITYNEVLQFTKELSKIYRWDIYEKNTLGKTEEILKYYSVILFKWMKGYGTKQIIQNAIDYNKQNKSIIYKNGTPVGEYDDSKEYKNIIINKTLDDIEDIILFRLSNYFLKFSLEKKKINGEKLGNDWYEFIEYGTDNKLSILLQEYGFSREIARYIKEEQKKYIFEDKTGKLRLRNTILDNDNIFFKKELEAIRYNYPELFIN